MQESALASTFSDRKIENIYAPFLYHLGFSRNEDSTTSEGFVPGSFGTSEGKNAVHFSFVSPLDSCSNSKYKFCILVKDHHDQLFVIDQEATQNSQVFSQTANGSFLCHGTVPAEFFTKIINIKDGSGRFVKEDFKKKNRHQRKEVDATKDSRGKSSSHDVKQEALETRQLGGITSKAEIQKENRSS